MIGKLVDSEGLEMAAETISYYELKTVRFKLVRLTFKLMYSF